jgi:predicted nucleotidyltransferase
VNYPAYGMLVNMVDKSIIEKVRQYLGLVRNAGVDVTSGVIYGSVARGEATEDSDIDLLVLAPEFDSGKADSRIRLLWRLRQYADSRIEPVAVGVREFEEDDASPLIGAARRDGFMVSLPAVGMVGEEASDYGGTK